MSAWGGCMCMQPVHLWLFCVPVHHVGLNLILYASLRVTSAKDQMLLVHPCSYGEHRELEDPPPSLKPAVWERHSLSVNYSDNGQRLAGSLLEKALIAQVC